MTNQPLYTSPQPIALDYLPNRMMWTFLGKSIGRAIGRALYGEKVVLHAGISPDWQRGNSNRRIAGLVLFYVGLLMAIPGALIHSANRFVQHQAAAGGALVEAVLMLIMMSVVIGGIVLLVRSAPLRVLKIEGNHVWLRGADGGFLASLPKWARR